MRKSAAIKRLEQRSVEMSVAYDELTEALGVHLRRELDRRYLAEPPNGEVATR